MYTAVPQTLPAGRRRAKRGRLAMITSLNETDWIVVDDAVMGGRSRGHLSPADEGLVFHGTLNTRGGGFTSVRSRGLRGTLVDASGLIVKLHGDGRRYALDLRRLARGAGREAVWRAPLPTVQGREIEVVVPFDDFVPTWRGRRIELQGGPHAFWRTAGSVGITLADGVDGPFRLLLKGVDGVHAGGG